MKGSAVLRSGGAMPNCDHCGAHVSDQFVRVFADESGDIRACPACAKNAGIAGVALSRAKESSST